MMASRSSGTTIYNSNFAPFVIIIIGANFCFRFRPRRLRVLGAHVPFGTLWWQDDKLRSPAPVSAKPFLDQKTSTVCLFTYQHCLWHWCASHHLLKSWTTPIETFGCQMQRVYIWRGEKTGCIAHSKCHTLTITVLVIMPIMVVMTGMLAPE